MLQPSITHLRLVDFRNYSLLDCRPAAAPVVLFGANGAGKTNLLEALSLLAPGRGLRRASLADMDRDSGGPWSLMAEIAHADGPLRVASARDAESNRRRIQLFDRPLRGPGALAELMAIFWLTPAMDRLFLDAASGRRRFLDRLVLTIQPDHAARVSLYERSMRERGAILRERGADPVWLDTIEQRLAEVAVAIAAARLTLADALLPLLADPGPTLPALQIGVRGDVEDDLAVMSALDAETRLADRLRASRSIDGRQGGAMHGTHRSDLTVTDTLSGEPAARISTGRQKAVLLAITLGEARLRRQLHGDWPILLLDEVAAHLDAERRRQLCRALIEIGAQVFLTGTDRHLFAEFGDHAQFLEIDRGRISRHE